MAKSQEINRNVLHIDVFGLPNDESRDCDIATWCATWAALGIFGRWWFEGPREQQDAASVGNDPQLAEDKLHHPLLPLDT